MRGIWFAAARRYLSEVRGSAGYQDLVDVLAPDTARALADSFHSDWLPEECLQDLLHGLHRVLANGDDRRYEKICEDCTYQGIHKFMRSLLGLGSPQFLVGRVPMLWSYIRRGPGVVLVAPEANRVVLRFREFPYFDDDAYLGLTHGVVRALLRVSKRRPVSRALERGDAHLTLELTWS